MRAAYAERMARRPRWRNEDTSSTSGVDHAAAWLARRAARGTIEREVAAVLLEAVLP